MSQGVVWVGCLPKTAWPRLCFLVQEATGFAMTLYYRPTVTEAFASVQYIMTESKLWLVNPISSSMVGKYDGLNDDPTRISRVSHRWF